MNVEILIKNVCRLGSKLQNLPFSYGFQLLIQHLEYFPAGGEGVKLGEIFNLIGLIYLIDVWVADVSRTWVQLKPQTIPNCT